MSPDPSAQHGTSAALRYGLAAVAVAIALGFGLLARSQGLRNVEFPPFLMAVSVTVWYAGPGPGVLAVILAILSFDYFFVEPLYSLDIQAPDRPMFAVFIAFVSMIAWFSSRRRRIEQQLRQARAKLETEVTRNEPSRPACSISRTTLFSSVT